MTLTPIADAHAMILAEMHKYCFDTPWDEAQFVDLLRLPTTRGWICENGFILYSVVAEQADIMTFCVLPAVRRQGLGAQLLEQMFADIKSLNIPVVFLEVSDENPSAQKLYEKMGFKVISIRPKYYRTPAGYRDALCYRKEL